MTTSLSQLPGFRVGHWTDLDAGTGCTVILCPEGAVAGVDVRGGAPGTREIASALAHLHGGPGARGAAQRRQRVRPGRGGRRHALAGGARPRL